MTIDKIERAIEYIKNPIGKSVEQYAEFEEITIQVLTQVAEREKGSEFCNAEGLQAELINKISKQLQETIELLEMVNQNFKAKPDICFEFQKRFNNLKQEVNI